MRPAFTLHELERRVLLTAAVPPLIDVDFTAQSPVQSGAAVIGQNTDQWNNLQNAYFDTSSTINVSNTRLNFVDGKPSPASISYTTSLATHTANQLSPFQGTADSNLMNAYLIAGEGTTGQVTFTGLDPNATFNIFLYSGANVGAGARQTTFTITTGTSQSPSGTVTFNQSASTFIVNQNYVELTATAAGSSLTVQFVGHGDEADLNGIQLQQTSSETSQSLSFPAPIANGKAGQTLTPFAVDVLDTGGGLDAADDSSVTLTLASGSGALSGTTTVNAVDGVATFSNVSVAPNGTYSVAAADTQDGLSNATSNTFTVSSTSTITPIFKKVLPIPSTVVAGQNIKGLIPIEVTNSGTLTKGTIEVSIYLNTVPTLNGSQVLVASGKESASLKTGKSATLNLDVKSIPLTLPTGNYYVLVVTTDPAGGSNVIASPQTFHIEAVSLNLTGTISATKFPTLTPKPDKAGSFTLTVTNTGNVPLGSNGPFELAIDLVNKTANQQIAVATVAKSFKINPNQTKKLTVNYSLSNLALLSGLTPGTWTYSVSISTKGPSSSGTPVTATWVISQ